MKEGLMMGEVIFLLILWIGSFYFFTLTAGFSISVLDKSGGAALFPRLILIFLMVVIGVRIIKLLLLIKNKENEDFVFVEMFKGTRLIYVGGLTLYVVLMPILGYILSTIVFMVGMMNIFYYNVHKSLGTLKAIIIRNILAILLVIAVNIFFKNILGVYLPSGFFGN